ncbi:HAMP domain-containing protein [Catenovulum sp. SM1970]|uniref:sensor histidine kinase n=1 Tax=Marinifaba aquimaris TaxID=2741323 RepID=UPI0015741FD9|nr:ATP-binding protein [Marinifaba aquimaris]NTS77428.1 HAMP domain-containing protein [Marinifaba aquimaris]
MKVFDSLFWRIFFVLWLTNATIITSAAVLIILDIESSRQQLLQEQRMERSISPLVGLYEQGMPIMSNKEQNNAVAHFSEMYNLTKNVKVYGNIPEQERHKIQSFTFTSKNDQEYKINYLSLPHKTEIWVALKAYFSPIRGFFALLIISLFSAALSKTIIKPIKQLRRHVKNLATGEQEVEMNQKLLARKDEIGHLAISIQQMSTRINQLINDKQNLLYDVSHELRAPIARMQVANALAAQFAESADLPQKSYNQIDKDIESLTKMIDEILTLARIEHTPDSGNTECFSVKAFLTEQVNNAQVTHADRVINLSGQNVEITTDKSLLQKAINNFIANALKHTDEKLDLSIDSDEQSVTITIRDHGPGIDEEKLKTIFKPFARGETNAKGFGLGLAIAAKAIDRIHGKLNVQNVVNSSDTGLSISITLPLHIT